ncbi:hypothetical protein OUZ56_027352 [Daphnia magna]|uniref:Uncharacterized protein n=1 Tax=Daphnia magna TaxID=35525 RepID=A0ABQ9ZPI5_9CRUS|nr:hypothetical protein OUZ56_027352 [Daphnia magna]
MEQAGSMSWLVGSKIDPDCDVMVMFSRGQFGVSSNSSLLTPTNVNSDSRFLKENDVLHSPAAD